MEFNDLQPYVLKRKAIDSALTLFYFDQDTLAPKDAIENTSTIIGILSKESFDLINDPKVKEILNELKNQELPLEQKSIVREWLKDIARLEKIPSNEYQSYQELKMKSQRAWQEAKEKNDYQIFKPYLKEVVETEKRFAGYRKNQEANLYDVLLNDYEPGFTTKSLDAFFLQLRQEIVPLLKKVQASTKKIDRSFLFKEYDVDLQRKFNFELAKYIGFDFNRGVMSETEHPYTTNLHNKDVRITNHYYLNNVESALFSTIHESGHAIYEMGISDQITMSAIGTGVSMGMHESQSRFYENMIGRNPLFWKKVYPKLQETFNEQLKDVTLDDFTLAINHAESSFIRTEADELTYALHIMVRYEIEKKMFMEEMDYDTLPQLWNDLYKEYLGIIPKDDREGILQDMHWAGGMLGYFPSYAIGSAIASQIYSYMQKTTEIEHWIEDGRFDQIKQFLGEHIHQYGCIYSTNEMLEMMMGEKFNPQYYVNYLKEKFMKVYELK